MANALPNGGTHQRTDRFASTILQLLRKDLVTNEQDIFSTDYEGNPIAGAVKIPIRDTEVEIGDYNVATGKTLTQSSTTFLTVAIDTDKAVNEIIDGYEAKAVPDNLIAQRLNSASYSMGLEIDTDAIATLELGGTTSANTTASTTTTAYANFLDENTELDLADVPVDNRFAIISPAFYKVIKQDTAFVSATSDRGFEEVKKMGFVGEIDGVRCYKSNNMSTSTEFIIGHKAFCQRIMEWKTEPTLKDLTNEYIESSAVQGRYVREHVVTRAEAVRVKTKI